MAVYSVEDIPRPLKAWYTINAIIDLCIGIPLCFAPYWTLFVLNFANIEPTATRLVGGLLMGSGLVTILSYHKSKEVYSALLQYKIIWNLCAICALVLSLKQTTIHTIVLLGLYVSFLLVWSYYKLYKKI